MKFTYRFTRAPVALRAAKLDNIVLIPASLLCKKETYQAVANRLPTGSILICTPRQCKQRNIVASVARFYQGHGHQVTTISQPV